MGSGAETISAKKLSLLGLEPLVMLPNCLRPCYLDAMSKREALLVTGVVVLSCCVLSVSVSAEETLPQQVTTTTLVEQFDAESGLIWSQVDDQTIEVSLPG